ncbi:nicotinate-nucleotide--dimethylbenzimidazole phosphoribosyltransferase [Alkalihalobacillus oceani]|uniref:nicotinate-nucleotide--dimethylbenzimidazole phosphoribosyltransferase n=1 Tax=Halalkalibacter oceani TaxID=1653776 RepID=UPI0020415BC4|nr:nicotinate-nucleotide--dimethylbenzimidazole phosphoribosyltransferase [Halalkalibacter oceani]MCM3760404.1 nicotinate-nucleotide--dimethylbenzimidazole phosphoribosyltransferase [Halalkalibacter oceani]
MTIQPFDLAIIEQAKAHLDQLTKPLGSLGRVEELAVQLAGITGEVQPVIEKPAIIVAAADHGIVSEGVSAYPQEVTALMIDNFVKGGAAINVFARQIGATVTVADVGVNQDLGNQPIAHHKIRYGTGNFLHEDAMTEEEATSALKIGRQLAISQIEQGHRLLITGEMGIGNTSASSALTAAMTGSKVEDVVGYGTGINQETKRQKIAIIEKALTNRGITAQTPPLSILAKVGGLEIATLAGVILEGAARRVPVLIDGFISSAAALVAAKLEPEVHPYLMIAHQSVEDGHRIVTAYLQSKPLLQLDLRLGEGTGAALAYPIVEAASRMMREMATFKDIGM